MDAKQTPSEQYLEGYESALADLDNGNAMPYDTFPKPANNFQKGWNDCMAKMRIDNGPVDTRPNWRSITAMVASAAVVLVVLRYTLVLMFSI
jgi:hypothetical protein